MSSSEDSTEIHLAEIVFPHHCTHLGTLFGAQALAWMDKAAFLVSCRFAGRTTVTARSDRVDFKHPIRLGDIVEIVATIKATGRSSITVGVSLLRDDQHHGGKLVTTAGDFVMVAVDAGGAPVKLDRPFPTEMQGVTP